MIAQLMSPGTISSRRWSQWYRSACGASDTTPPAEGRRPPGRTVAARSGSVDRGQPGAVGIEPAPHRVEIGSRESNRQRAGPALAYRASIDLDHRRHLRAGPTQEDLVGLVELRAIDRALDDGDPQVPGDTDEANTSDPFKNIVRDGRRDQCPVSHDEK